MTPYFVTQCVCHHKTFAEIIAFADEHDFTMVEELREADFCSQKCKMCEPYIELALKTGETAFKPGCYNQRKLTS